MSVQIHEFDANFFEGSVAEKMPLDSRESLVRIVISLFYQSQLLSL